MLFTRAQAPTLRPWFGIFLTFLPVIFGIFLLYIPSLIDLFQGIWTTETQIHGPIVLGISLWLLHHNWDEMIKKTKKNPPQLWGWIVISFGLLLYAIGRSQGILSLEIGSVIWFLAGTILIYHGAAALKVQWFALFFMLFMVPLPSGLVDAITMPMKLAVSYVAEHFLYGLGYPVARTGVMLQVGQYMLLVADACAGLHTLLTLEALGLLYLKLVQRKSAIRNIGLGLLIIPISFTANVIRVITLCMITYYFGDAAGQGFLHGFAGILLFISALLLIIGTDALLHTCFSPKSIPNSATPMYGQPHLATEENIQTLRKPISHAMAYGLLMLFTAGLAWSLTPTHRTSYMNPIQIETTIPAIFGDWQMEPNTHQAIVNPQQTELLKQIYSQTLSRSYKNTRTGEKILLSIAYGEDQRDSMQLHYPEVCYPAQGFQVLTNHQGTVQTAQGDIPVRRLETVLNNHHFEPLTYWAMIGSTVVLEGTHKKLAELRYGLRGQIPDGLVFRVSSIDTATPHAFLQHETFINALLNTLPADYKLRFAGITAKRVIASAAIGI